jgi:uncharacterized protein YegL
MKTDLTDITIVLDRSGSMMSVADDTRGGFDTFIEDQKRHPGGANVTLVQFDTEYEFVHRCVPIGSVPKLEFVPRGSTALLDAIGRAITETGERLKATAEADRPAKVLFVILTDGQENSSREFKKARIAEMIKHQTEIYKWQFVFLAANQDAIAEAGGLGILAGNAANYVPTSTGVNLAFAKVSKGTTDYRSGNAAAVDKFFVDDEQEQKAEVKS